MSRAACNGCPTRVVNWPIWASIFLFLGWGLMMILSADAAGGTAMSAIRDLLEVFSIDHHLVVGIALVTCGLLAGYGSRKGLMWLVPMQALYVAAAFGCLQAVWDGHYADGEPRHRLFIAADQWPVIVGAVVYTFALLEEYAGWSLARLRH